MTISTPTLSASDRRMIRQKTSPEAHSLLYALHDMGIPFWEIGFCAVENDWTLANHDRPERHPWLIGEQLRLSPPPGGSVVGELGRRGFELGDSCRSAFELARGWPPPDVEEIRGAIAFPVPPGSARYALWLAVDPDGPVRT